MTARVEITALETTGDGMKVTGQGKVKQAAKWLDIDRWSFTVPEYIGKFYRIGQILRITVKS